MEDLHLKAGLVKSGKNADGEDEYIGTKEQWDMYEILEREETAEFKRDVEIDSQIKAAQEEKLGL